VSDNSNQQQEDPLTDEKLIRQRILELGWHRYKIATSAAITEEDVVLTIKQSKEKTEDSDEEENNVVPVLTAKESLQYLQTFRRTLEQWGATIDDCTSFYNIEKKCKN